VIGEKLLDHIRAADSRPKWAEKLPIFVATINPIFTADERRRYFATTTCVDAAVHVTSDYEYETMPDAGMVATDVVSGAADAILFERARAPLLGDDRYHP
jgi:hypothetical protein